MLALHLPGKCGSHDNKTVIQAARPGGCFPKDFVHNKRRTHCNVGLLALTVIVTYLTIP
jgi:hypothetical protein